MTGVRHQFGVPREGGSTSVGDSPIMWFLTLLPMLVGVGLAVLFIVLGVRLVRAVERIADKMS
jgi:hypothetical protein